MIGAPFVERRAGGEPRATGTSARTQGDSGCEPRELGRGRSNGSVTSTSRSGTVDDMGELVITLAMLVMVVAGAGVIAYILRNKLDQPDLPSERANEMARTHAVERGNHSNMGPT